MSRRAPGARRGMRRAAVPVLLALALALAGCSSSGSDNPTLSAPSPTTSAAPQATGSASPADCPLQAQQVPPPAGVSSDLTAKPAVPPSSAPAPQQVQVADVVAGTGPEARTGSRVEVKYVGAFYDSGKEFDSSWSRGASQTLPFGVCQQGVIPGFAIAPIGMKVGGRRLVVIPSTYGYGAQGSGPIPGGATLVFVLDLVSVSG